MHGLTPTLILMFFLAAAPVALMPTIIAAVTWQRSAWRILVANVVLWGLIFWGVRSFTIESSASFRLPTFLALLAWLALLGFSVRSSSHSSHAKSPDDAGWSQRHRGEKTSNEKSKSTI